MVSFLTVKPMPGFFNKSNHPAIPSNSRTAQGVNNELSSAWLPLELVAGERDVERPREGATESNAGWSSSFRDALLIRA
jgi:hypothetical protein